MLGLEGGGGETDAEALEASGTAFGFVFEASDLLQPCLVVVVAVYPADAEAVGVTLALVLADVVLLAGEDVGVEVEDGRSDVVPEHPLDDGGGAGSATGMEQDFVEAFRNDDVVLFLHVRTFCGAKVAYFGEKWKVKSKNLCFFLYYVLT